MPLNKPSAILFDWDNTLVDTWPLIHRALHLTMEKWEQVPWTLEEVKQRVGKSMRDSFPDMFGEQWEAAGEFYLTTYRALALEGLQPLQGVHEMLRAAKKAAPYVGVVSNKMGESLRREVLHHGFADYFDVLIGAGDADRDKPYADPALAALEPAGISMNASVWFVGDTTTDLGCAQAGGMSAILYGEVEPEEEAIYLGYPFAYHVKNHSDLLSLLQKYS